MKLWVKIGTFGKNWNFRLKLKFWSNIKLLANNWNFGEKSKFWLKMISWKIIFPCTAIYAYPKFKFSAVLLIRFDRFARVSLWLHQVAHFCFSFCIGRSGPTASDFADILANSKNWSNNKNIALLLSKLYTTVCASLFEAPPT